MIERINPTSSSSLLFSILHLKKYKNIIFRSEAVSIIRFVLPTVRKSSVNAEHFGFHSLLTGKFVKHQLYLVDYTTHLNVIVFALNVVLSAVRFFFSLLFCCTFLYILDGLSRRQKYDSNLRTDLPTGKVNYRNSRIRSQIIISYRIIFVFMNKSQLSSL